MTTPDDGATDRMSGPEHVEDLLDAGRPRLAAQALVDVFDDCLPELPLRFALVLVRVDERIAAHIADATKTKERIDLRLDEGPREGLSVFLGARRVGDLSSQDSDLVRDFGPQAALFTPRLLEILYRDGELQTLAIELIRPEQRRCARCGQEVAAADTHRCPAEETHDETGHPVRLQSALNSLLRDRNSRRSPGR